MEPVRLDWANDPKRRKGPPVEHWLRRRRNRPLRVEQGDGYREPCIHCGRLTWLCDDDGRASHKVCAERVLAGDVEVGGVA
jgi:hypothetical protein